jgi:hypothetical protein
MLAKATLRFAPSNSSALVPPIEIGIEYTQLGHRGNLEYSLQVASGRGQTKTVQLLLNNGANVNAQGGVYGNALQAASRRGHTETVQLLLEKGAVEVKLTMLG